MKILLTIATAVLLSTTAQTQAQTEIAVPDNKELSQETITESTQDLPTESLTDLWKSLDSNEDESISKEEAIESKEVTTEWEKLDVNKDEKLDRVEFLPLFAPKQ